MDSHSSVIIAVPCSLLILLFGTEAAAIEATVVAVIAVSQQASRVLSVVGQHRPCIPNAAHSLLPSHSLAGSTSLVFFELVCFLVEKVEVAVGVLVGGSAKGM